MTTQQREKGQAFARRMVDERVKSKNLPNLGRGYTDVHRAAYAVILVAEKKALACPRWERAFWKAVGDEARQIQVRDCNERMAAESGESE